MASDNELLKRVIDDPCDRVARLVYADFLMEKGDPRGDFIRLQCELDEADPYAEDFEAMEAQQNKLLKKHRAAWTKDLKSLATAIEMRCGFVEHVSVKAEVCGKHLPKLMKLAPVRSLKLCGDRKSLSQVAKCKSLSKLEMLSVSSMRLGGEFGASLFASKHLSGIRTLDVSHNGLGPKGLQSVVDCPSLQNLEALDLADNRLGDEGLKVLADAELLRQLKHLSLNSARVHSSYLMHLVESGKLGNLQSLDLERTNIGEALPDLAAVDDFRPRRLRIHIAAVTPAGIEALAASGTLAQIEHLDIYWGEMGDAGARALAKAKMPNLKWLDVGYNRISDAGGQALMEASWMGGLRELRMMNNKLGPKTMKALASSPGLKTLVRVDFSGSNISQRAAALLAKADFESTIRELAFSHKEPSSFLRKLIESGNFPKLKHAS